MKRQVSLRTELILLCIGIVVVTTVVQILGNLLFSQKIAIAEKEGQVEELYNILVENYSDDPITLYDLLEPYQESQNIHIHIEGTDGVIYISNSVQVGDMDVDLYSQRFPDLHENVVSSRDDFMNKVDRPPEGGTEPAGGRYTPVETDQILVQLTESFYYEGEVRTVVLWSSVAALEESVSLFTRINIVVSVVVLLLGIVLIFFLSRRLTTPIVAVDGVAKKMAGGDFTTRAQEDIPTKELSSLASSINTMSDSLQHMIATLERDNQSLVHEVEDQQKIEKMRRQFIANISHEMKTPLALLMMYSESLKLDIPNIDKNHYYDTIIEEAKGLNDMVAQLLDISSLENGLSELSLTPLNLSVVIQEIVDKFEPILAPYQCSISIQEHIWVMGEAKHLTQAVNNYLNNAVSHTKEGECIELILEQKDGKGMLTIYNEGGQVADDDLPYLWDSFYRADKARTSNSEKRIGLGLYLVKTAIQAHNGIVFVENRTEGVAFSFAIDTIAPPKG